ncbi:MAG TPA: plasmid pRiA4b ORF-3 family protein [Nakamurella sp.]
MSRRKRGHLQAVPDPNTSIAPKDRPRKRRRREPDPELFPGDDLILIGDMPPLAEIGVMREIAALGRAADDLSIDDILDQLAVLGMPPELVEQGRDLGDDHRAELAGLLTAATAMVNGDPVAGLLGVWRPLLDKKMTAFDAEIAAAEILGAFDGAADDDDQVERLTWLIEEAEHTGRAEALVMCRMLGHLGPAEVRGPAVRAANTLAAGGIRDRPWVSSLGTARFERAYGFDDDGGRVLAVEFAYGRRPHAFVLLLDELDGGVVGLYASDDTQELFRQIRLEALAHARHPAPVDAGDAAEIIRSALAQPFCPEDEDELAEMEGIVPIVLERLRHLPHGAPAATEPARRADADPPGVAVSDFGPPPWARAKVVHRIKVTIAGCKPPIWRRLEVSSELGLLALHDVLQVSFGWSDQHLWQFTARGRVYGIDEAKQVTVGEVAPGKGDAFEYLYDFGDRWVHRIRVEEVGPGDPDVGYPRCLAGRRPGPAAHGYEDPEEMWAEDHEDFDVDELNDRLDRHARRKRRR